MSLLYLGRSICVVSTQLPTPFHAENDMYHHTWDDNLFYEALLVLLRVKATNNDVFYSGHTVVITLSALSIETYSERRWLIVLLWIYSIFSLYVIIATKFHYTIDVLIAFVLSIIIWKFYHMTMKIKTMRNYLPVFKWFESDKEAIIYSRSDTSVSGTTHDTQSVNNHGYNLNKVAFDTRIFSDILSERQESNPSKLYDDSTPCEELPYSLKSVSSVTVDLP
eukprot:89184_1